MCFIRPATVSSGSRIIAIAACATSFRLWLGISVAMPTAMPDAPFSSTTGRRAGRIDRLLARAVVVGHEVDGAHVELGQQHFGEACQARFRVSIGRRFVAVARAEVAFAVDQRIAHGEVLREPHQGVVHRLVAVRMEFTEHLADHGRGLRALGARARAVVPHRIENAALHRLLAVAHARQRAVLHGGDRVLQVLRRGVAPERQRIADTRRTSARNAAAARRLRRRIAPWPATSLPASRPSLATAVLAVRRIDRWLSSSWFLACHVCHPC